MKFTDIVELAKQGYTPADIKELMALSDNSDQQADDQGVQTPPEQEQNEGVTGDAGVKPQPDEQKTEQPTGSNAESIDYKKLYENSQAELKKAQQANITQTLKQPENVSDEEALQNIVRGFM